MIVGVIIIFILQYLPTAQPIDLLQEGRRVVLQKDIEYVLVRLDLTSIKRAILNSRKAVLKARGLLLGNTLAGKMTEMVDNF